LSKLLQKLGTEIQLIAVPATVAAVNIIAIDERIARPIFGRAFSRSNGRLR
jgi:hypothetical protein